MMTQRQELWFCCFFNCCCLLVSFLNFPPFFYQMRRGYSRIVHRLVCALEKHTDWRTDVVVVVVDRESRLFRWLDRRGRTDDGPWWLKQRERDGKEGGSKKKERDDVEQ